MSEKKTSLTYETRNCWDVYATPKHRKAMDELATRYREFLSTCKTERETIEYVRDKVQKAGFTGVLAHDKIWRDMRGKTMFLARRGKRPLAEGVRLVGAHADTPRLDLKQHPLYEECGVGLAKTHYYGGIRKHQWFARPLALHGVIVRTDGRAVVVNLGEDPSDPVFTVLDLLPHLAYGQMEKTVTNAFEAEKLNIVFGHEPRARKEAKGKDDAAGAEEKNRVKGRVLDMLSAKYGVVEEDLFSAELQIVPAGAARPVGLDGSLIGGYGQDDRICVFAALEALLTSKAPEHTQVVLFWDKEEIGSEGATGAKSLFFEYCMDDLVRAWAPRTRLSEVFLNTRAVSADVHGALDPDYQDVHEKLNSSLLGHGPVFCKFTGHRGKVGANDAHAEYVGFLRGLLNRAGIPWQMAELGRVDLGGGGTVAKYLAAYGMDIIDFGPGVLSMHSPFEISSKADLYATTLAYREFLQS